MLISLTTFLTILSSLFRARAALQLENLALRHQIGVLQRSAAKRSKLTPVDPGTADAATFLHQETEFGVVAVGRRADLLLLEANPLQDVKNVSKRAGVMVNGQWLTETELQRRLLDLRNSYQH
jgi:hypothetical protein